MSVFASAASMPTRLPTTPAVGSGIPATGGGACFSRPKPNRPRFFFSGAADGGGLHSSTGGVAGSGMRSAPARGSALAGLPHGSADVAFGDGAVQVCVFCAGAGALHASFAGGDASAGGAHESRTGADDGGLPHGSSDAAGVAGAGGAVQRSAVGAGGALVPHWSGAAVGAHELPDSSAGAGCSGSVGAGPKIPDSALRRSSKA